MNFLHISPEEAGISSRHILNFINAAQEEGIELHSLLFLRHGKVYAQGWWAPYKPETPHIMFSFTKSLTSTAIGFAVQEGLLQLNDRLVDIFPDKLPENPCENLLHCTLRDLLMMGCGHETELPSLGLRNEDWVAAFLAHPFPHAPGTHFLYNTAGSNMLVAILRRKTGKNLLEFLQPRLFAPLGMEGVLCYQAPDGTDLGGFGSRLTTENMGRFTQFVANKGSWNGQQLLNPEWFTLATAKHIDNGTTGHTPDWQAGYGFQFWRCTPAHTFRGDGAFGQYGVVCEEEGAVFVITSATTTMERILELLWTHVKANFKDAPLPADPQSEAILNHTLQQLQLILPLNQGLPQSALTYNGNTYCAQNAPTGTWAERIGGAGISGKYALLGVVPLNTTDQLQQLTVTFTPTQCCLTADYGQWQESLPISLTGHYNNFWLGDKPYGAAGRWIGPDEFAFDARCTQAATGTCFLLHFSENGLTLSSRPSLAAWGGLGDNKEPDILFTLKK